jgi:hypothetical protein
MSKYVKFTSGSLFLLRTYISDRSGPNLVLHTHSAILTLGTVQGGISLSEAILGYDLEMDNSCLLPSS